MNVVPNPQWLVCENREEAIEAQEDAINDSIKYIGGMDVSNTPFDPKQLMFTAAVVSSYPSLAIVQTATQLVMSCLKKHRLPEPTRYAHLAANSCRRDFLNQTRSSS